MFSHELPSPDSMLMTVQGFKGFKGLVGEKGVVGIKGVKGMKVGKSNATPLNRLHYTCVLHELSIAVCVINCVDFFLGR